MKPAITATLFAITTIGCAPPPATAGASNNVASAEAIEEATDVETIEYSRQRCRGKCPVYRFTLRPDGRGRFTGIAFTAATGEHEFMVTPEQASAFRQALQPYRPDTGQTRRYVHRQPGCMVMATDMPGAGVIWLSGETRTSLYFNFGCEPAANREMTEALRNAPDLIPALKPLIHSGS